MLIILGIVVSIIIVIVVYWVISYSPYKEKFNNEMKQKIIKLITWNKTPYVNHINFDRKKNITIENII